MWHELQQMNAADGILTILKQTQREEIRSCVVAVVFTVVAGGRAVRGQVEELFEGLNLWFLFVNKNSGFLFVQRKSKTRVSSDAHSSTT